jgi:hypothetical protein
VIATRDGNQQQAEVPARGQITCPDAFPIFTSYPSRIDTIDGTCTRPQPHQHSQRAPTVRGVAWTIAFPRESVRGGPDGQLLSGSLRR